MDDTRLAGEVKRAFAARRFDRSLDELLASRRGSTPKRLWLLVATAVVAGVVFWAARSTPLPGGPQTAFAGWAPIPSQPDVMLASSAMAACGPSGELEGMRMVGQDQRGNAAAFLFASNSQLSMCLLVEDNSGAVVVATTGSARLAAVADALIVDSGISQPAGAGTGGLTIIGGRVAEAVSSVAIERADGADVSATVADGYFLAWWPTSSEADRVVAKDARGTQVAAVRRPF